MIKHMKRDKQLLILFIPCILFYIIFRYGPLYGLIIAFKDYSVFTGIIDSPWVGLKHFNRFFLSQDFFMLFKNTLLLGFFSLVFGFPFPIILAIMLNEIRVHWFKKIIQTASYLPTFLSVVIISSMIIDFLSPNNGLINQFISLLGFEKKYFLIDPDWFRPIYVISDIWSSMGYEAIIFLAAIASISPTLYEAAKVDGCSRFQMMRHITLPGILPTILIIFILKTGSMIRIGYEKVLLLYNAMTYDVADVFSTFVYRKGLLESNYSYGAAVGMFEAVVAMVMLIGANSISKRLGGGGIW
ncbi:sugar ABC transporter permease [Paenibacillus nasutitermitis]|uniref:Sugar ABC transporter permease n=2 Tax=Paenibacillus nasutitermitis TaxID=1652958 RepID=A0A917DZM0_9BACL|nr:ABC transporter permease subunit [Paenibacillus nasutitermitis]GGD82529.1 sugar ABC transporter permease [Paenibacillus nasutitermitis]